MEVANKDPEQHQKWLNKHGFNPNENGEFPVHTFEGKIPVEPEDLLEHIKHNVSTADYRPLEGTPLDDRTFVMVCGGPSLADHLGEIRQKTLQRDKYWVVCSNMTAKYLIEHEITPHAHFIIDPQKKKIFDLSVTLDKVQYWINVACHPAVFEALKIKGIKPFAFLADWDKQGRAVQCVKDNLPRGIQGLLCVQGGTMAGLRAINIADALGFRKMEFYGFDATVRIEGDKAYPYAYDKRRGEAIIDVKCPACDARFDTTLIFQKQVEEFLHWRLNMPWMEISIIGGGLIDHAKKHAEELEAKKPKITYRYTDAYKDLQKRLHAEDHYGGAGTHFTPTIFHSICQLAKRLGNVHVLDYGAAKGWTMETVRERFWLPPNVTDAVYDPFIEGIDADPKPADFVICNDVMEHVEPQCTDAVLDHIQALTRRMVFFSIYLKPAQKFLADGRNAHINLRPVEEWLKKLNQRFLVSEVRMVDGDIGLLVIGQSLEDVREVLSKRRMAA